jgi:rRNA maturation endonuclease Nob1
VIEEFEDEYVCQPRLQTKFPWVLQAEYVANRRCKLTVSRAQRKDIAVNLDFIQGTARSTGSTVSGVDARALAIAMTLGVACVTDDAAMLVLAKEFAIKTMTTLQLLKLMVACNHCKMEKVIEVVSYWRYSKDVPKNWRIDFRSLFGMEPPGD